MLYQLDPFGYDQRHQIPDVSVIRMLLFGASWQSQHCSVKKQKIEKQFRSKRSLIWLMCAWIRLWSDHSHPEVTSDHTIPRPKWLLIIPSPDQRELWPYHPQTELTSDHTTVPSNQIPNLVILVWEHTVCVGLGLIRGHFRTAPQPWMVCLLNLSRLVAASCSMWNKNDERFKTFKKNL